MRRLWACVVAKLEDTHRRRTVMTNAKARGIELGLDPMSFGFRGLDWLPVAPPIPVETDMPPTDFDG
jgi:hypothetical protein